MKKQVVALLSLLTLVVGAFAGPYDTWTKYRTISINTRASGGGANVATSQANFPVLVRLSNASAATGADVLSEALPAGADLRFTNSTGSTALSYEIESWSATAAAIWVRVPTVHGNSVTDIRLYWGNGAASAASSASAVFGSNNFLGVWHMGNASGAASRPNAVNDGSANNAAPAGPATASMNPVVGVMGMADSMRAQGSGANGDHFSMGSITYPNQQTTMSLWMNMPDPQLNSGFTHFMTMGNTSSSHVMWFGREGTTNWRARGAGGTGAGNTGETDLPEQTTIANALLPLATWNQLAVTRDSSNGRRWRMYKNGSMLLSYYRGDGNTSSTLARHTFAAVSRSTHYIGRPIGWNDPTTHTKVDEARISSIARSPDWIKLDYETQKEAVTAVSLGSTTTNAIKPLTYTFKSSAYIHEQAITANDPAIHDSFPAPLSYAVSPALPNGLNLNTTTGVITGTPMGVSASAQYIVTATFADTVGHDTLTIVVNPAAPTALVYPMTTAIYGQNIAITANTPTVNSLIDPNYLVDTFTVSPALPAGLTLNPETGEITGTPTVASVATNYTVSATNAAGSTSQVLSITVLAPPTGLSYLQDPVTYDVGLPITGNVPTVTGTVTTWSVQSGTLPDGLTFNSANGIISGTPTAAGTGSFTIRAANLAGFVDEEVAYTVNAAENYATWSNVTSFNLNTTSAAAGVSEAQANFPVLVRLTAAHAAIFAAAKGDGADVRFSLMDGTRLPYEIDRWDSAGQKAEVWVLLTNVNANATTVVRMHYGNVSAVSKSNGGAVFNTTNNYVAVWHLGNASGINPRPNAVPGAPAATPSNNFTGAQFGGGSGTYVIPEGAIGKADTLRGGGNRNTPAATSDFLNIGNAADNTSSPYSGNNTFAGYSDFSNGYTYSVWAKVNAHANFTYFTTLANLTNGNDNIHVFRPDGTGQRIRFEQMNNTSGGGLITTTNPAVVQGAWSYVSVSVQPTEAAGTNSVSIYSNGALAGSGNSTQRPRVINRTNTWIGKSNWTGDAYISASFDEPRYSNVARSANWVKLEYFNQKPGTTPVSDLAYSAPSYTFVEESAITPVAAPTLVGTATRFAVSPALPAGLTINASTGAISGTPLDAAASQAYTVTAYGDSAWSTTTSFNLTVTSLPPGGIDYSSDTAVYQAGVLGSVTNTPTNQGTITSWSISPALPAGLSISPTTGVISGEPTAAAAQTNYEVIGTGPDGSDTAIVVITVTAPSENFSAWSNSRTIILNTSASGANVTGTVTNFPVLVRLGSAEASIFGQAMAAGADVRFTKANGVTRLPYQIVNWNSSTPSAEIWVKVDSVYGGNATQNIKMYWGMGGSADSSASSAVFGAGNGFSAVWHMGGTSGNETDATSNAFVATAVGSPLDAAGMIGRSRNLNGTSQYFAVTGSASSVLNYQMTDNYTLSSWVYVGDVPAVSNSGIQILNKGDNQYTLAAYDGAASPKYWEITTRGNNTYLQARSNGGIVTTTNSHIGSWRHITGTYKGAAVNGAIAESLYIDGVLINTLQSTNSNNTGRVTTFDVHLGALAGGTAPGNSFSRYLVGNLDEVRMAGVTRSPHWVKLDFESQKAYQTLTNIGYQPPMLSYAADSINAVNGLAISTQTPTVSGTVSAALSINPALPSGFAFNTATGAISGTATAVYGPVTHYITATNNGANAVDSIVVTVVNPAAPTAPVIIAPVFDATNVPVPVTVVWNKVTPPVTNYRLQGSEDSTFATTPLDTVVTDTSFSITEAPYATRLHLRVRATNAGGNGEWSDTISFNTIVAPPAISYTPDSVVYAVGQAIVAIDDSSTGGPIATYAITPDLNAATGLTFNTSTGAISGTPTLESVATDYTIVATGTGGTDTAVVSIAVGPAIPAAPMFVFPTMNATNVAVNHTALWNTVPGTVSSYRFQASTDSTFAMVGHDTTVADTGLGITAAPYATRIHYRVRAANASGNGAWTVVSFNTIAAPPTISYTPDSVVYTFGAAITPLAVASTGGPITGYTVLPPLPAGLALDTMTGTISGTPTAVSVEDDYHVVATGPGGTDTASISITVVPTVPGAPTTVLGQGGNAQAIVSWTAPASDGGSAITGYTVTSTPGGLTCTTAMLTCTVTGLTNATPYKFTVTAANAVGNSPASDSSGSVTPTPDPTAPSAPFAVMGAAGNGQVTVSWSAPASDGGSAITGYTATATPGGASCNTATLTCDITGLTNGTAYTFVVTATNAIGTSLGSTASDAVTPRTIPGAPTAVAGTAGNGQVSVAFTAPASNGGAAITNYTVVSHPGNFAANGATSPLIVAGLTNGTAYKFTVTATNEAGTGPASDTSAAVTPISVASAPTAVAAVAGNAQATVTFTAPASNGGSPITGYTVTSTPGGLTGTGATSPIVVTGLTNGTAYKFTVTATNGAGTGAVSDSSTAVTPITVAGAPTLAQAVAGNAQAAVSFTAPASNGGSAITGYTVTSNPGNLTGTGSVSPITVTGLTNGTAYTFTVVATNAAGNGAASDPTGSVTPAATPVISYATSPKSFTRNVADSMLVTSTGGAVASYSVSPALPAGLTLNATTGRIGGTPTTTTAAANYTVTATNVGGTATATVNITVLPGLPVIAYATSPKSFTLGINDSMLVTSTGGAVASYSVSPALPAGLTLNTTTGRIGGTATVAVAAANYTVTATNASGTATATANITVLPGLPVISYATSPKSFTRNVADSMLVTSTGGAVASYSVSPALPAGLTLNATTGRIGGTATAATAAANYTVTATNASGTATATVNITVLPGLPVIAYAGSPKSFTLGVNDSTLVTSTGGAVASYSVSPALPAGLTLNTTTGRIGGTATAATAAANYTVTATNASGTATATVNITVLPGLPVISYATSPKSFTRNVADSMLVTSTGGAVASYSVSPALPAGLTLNATTGRIGGTPTTAVAAANYTVTATNASGTATATVNITVLPGLPVIAYAGSPKTFTIGANDSLLVTSTGGAVASYSVSPALPAGLTLNTTTGRISGAATAAVAAANYTVTATNASGTATAVVNITVMPVSLVPGAYTFRVSGAERPYTFQIPAGLTTTELVTMRITDVWGRTVWTKSIRPNEIRGATEVVWNGRTSTGMLASAGMYVVRVTVVTDGKSTQYIQKSVTLKSR